MSKSDAQKIEITPEMVAAGVAAYSAQAPHDEMCFATRQDARRATMRYIEVFYNRWRPHTNNEGLPPATAMAKFAPERQPLSAAA